MSSIRNAILLVALAGIFAAGCQRPDYTGARAELNPTPIEEDPAMQIRQWSAVTASYPNGSVPAGATGIFRTPRRGMEGWEYYYADTSSFLLNVLALPYELWRTPPSREVIYPGETLEPTHTAVPPIPGELRAEAPAIVEEPATQPAAVPTTQPEAQPPAPADSGT